MAFVGAGLLGVTLGVIGARAYVDSITEVRREALEDVADLAHELNVAVHGEEVAEDHNVGEVIAAGGASRAAVVVRGGSEGGAENGSSGVSLLETVKAQWNAGITRMFRRGESLLSDDHDH